MLRNWRKTIGQDNKTRVLQVQNTRGKRQSKLPWVLFKMETYVLPRHFIRRQSQVDICGPFNAYSNPNKRATIKIWFVVLCCCTTGAVDCCLMEDYSADSFVLVFIRFSCRYGCPKQLLPDEGSQLVKNLTDQEIYLQRVKQLPPLHHASLGSQIANSINNLPIGLGNKSNQIENLVILMTN